MSNQTAVTVVRPADIIRAVRQCLADQQIDIAEIAKQAIQGAVDKAIQKAIASGAIDKAVKELATQHVTASVWSLREAVASKVANRMFLGDQEP